MAHYSSRSGEESTWTGQIPGIHNDRTDGLCCGHLRLRKPRELTEKDLKGQGVWESRRGNINGGAVFKIINYRVAGKKKCNVKTADTSDQCRHSATEGSLGKNVPKSLKKSASGVG